MRKRLLVIQGNTIPSKLISDQEFDRIIFTNDLMDKMQTSWFDKVKTLGQYEEELNCSYSGYEEAHNMIEYWKRIPVNSHHKKQLDELLKYESISILDILQSNLQIYYLSRIIGHIKLVEKIIEYEKPAEIFINNTSDYITRIFFLLGKAKGIKVNGVIKTIGKNFYANEILPFLRFSKSCYRNIIQLFPKWNFKQTKKKNNKSILFLSFNHRNLNTAHPVFSEMDNRGANCLFIHNSNQGVQYLNSNNLNYRSFNDFNNFKINLQTYLESRKFIKMWMIISKDLNFQKYFNYNGINYWEVIREIMEMIFSGGATGVIQNIEITKRILRTENPSALVSVGDRNSFVRSVFYYARKHKTPTILVQYGIIFGSAIWNSPITADIMCVESKKDKQFLEGISGNQEKILHTGQPMYDIVGERYCNSNKSDFCKKYNIEKNKKIILFTSVPYTEKIGMVDAALSKNEYIAMIKCFYNTSQQLPDAQFIIKLHPNENPEMHQEMINCKSVNNNLFFIDKESDTIELIHFCDLLITTFSTSGLEAIVLDKPVITINLTGQPDLVDYAEKGVAIGVHKKNDLHDAINNALYNQEARRLMAKMRKDYISDYLLDGNAKKRIGDVIESMAKA